MSENPAATFQPTRWSLVQRSQGEGEAAKRAMEDLCRAYWFPLYAWSRRYGASAQDAEDYVQGFFMELVEKRLFERADAGMGKLRTFLLAAFQRHVHDELRRQSRQKRGGGQVVAFDPGEAEAWYEVEQVAGESAEHLYDRQWALTVLDHALERVERRAKEQGKEREYEVMRPFLTGETGGGKAEEGARVLGLTGGAFKVAVHRMRARFREALREEVRETQGEGDDVEEEMGYLMRVLQAGG